MHVWVKLDWTEPPKFNNRNQGTQFDQRSEITWWQQIFKSSLQVTTIGGGNGGPHGPRPPHFCFWGAFPPTFKCWILPKNFK